MKFTQTLLASWLAAASVTPSVASQTPTVQQAGTRGAITHTETFDQGAQGYEAVRQFIVQHTDRDQRQFLDDGSRRPESFAVSYTAIIRASSDMARLRDIPGPPLPSSGKPGDTIGISACGTGVRQDWVYGWGSASTAPGWTLQSYSLKRVGHCKSQAAAAQ